MVSLLLIYEGITFFYTGFHNVDLVFNNQYLLAKQNKTIDSFYDQYNSNGDIISQGDLYIVGMEQMFIGFKLTLIGALFFGLTFLNLNFETEK